MENHKPACAECAPVIGKTGNTACKAPDKIPVPPANCPARYFEETIQAGFNHYHGDDPDARMARMAARIEGCAYRLDPENGETVPRWTRVEETIAFAHAMGFKRIGIATCVGLLNETRLLSEVLSAQGLEVVSLCCKAGSVDKCNGVVSEEEKVRPGGFEAACNPVAQAEILNNQKTDLNLIVGLCLGHDIVFTRHSRAPVTTLVVKDRVTGHNPVAALYGEYYFRRLKKPVRLPEKEE